MLYMQLQDISITIVKESKTITKVSVANVKSHHYMLPLCKMFKWKKWRMQKCCRHQAYTFYFQKKYDRKNILFEKIYYQTLILVKS